MRTEEAALHLFSSIVERLQATRCKLGFGHSIYIGMGNINTAVVHRRPAKDNIFHVHLVAAYKTFDALKPDKVYNACPVRQVGNESPLPSFPGRFKAQYLSPDLNVGHVAIQFSDGVDAASVHIFVREIIKQVLPGVDTQLLVEHRRPLRPHTGKELYVARS